MERSYYNRCLNMFLCLLLERECHDASFIGGTLQQDHIPGMTSSEGPINELVQLYGFSILLLKEKLPLNTGNGLCRPLDNTQCREIILVMANQLPIIDYHKLIV